MFKDEWVYVGHMLDRCNKALEISANIDKASYDQDETIRLALTHLIQVIGEAAQRVPVEFREKNPQIPWREIIGMRHRIVHDHLNVDEDVVWEVVQQDLPPRSLALEKVLPGSE